MEEYWPLFTSFIVGGIYIRKPGLLSEDTADLISLCFTSHPALLRFVSSSRMTSSSYADSIYVKSRYADHAHDASGCVDPPTDFSLAMLDMQSSGFETTLRPDDDLMTCYLGPEDSDARIYNAEVCFGLSSADRGN